MSPTFVITKRHTYEIQNDVYFAYSLEEAMARKEELESNHYTDGQELLIAEILDERNWFVRLVMWLTRKANDDR